VSKVVTGHIHAKDWKSGEQHGSLLGEGHGRWADVLADAVQLGYTGFVTMEPHLLGGGPTGGVTGPELFPKAVEAARGLLEKAGAEVG
jgi:sugar phosphate isomerase/epimerase